ncbi:hypothetical protein [Marinovum sp.]|uniref:hypothetical protein n=1 Tax=Marinovum sp. TaxID=2024839 RepID=UPI002B26A40A|nr:hypothetical protein [Marinovum sp.]
MVSKRDEAIALARQGHPPAEIAVRTGLAVNSVYHYLREARRAGEDIPNFQRGPRLGKVICIDAATVQALRPHANRRMCSTDELARQIVRRAAQGELIDSILDDEVALHG